MKKLLVILMAGVMLVSFAACGGNEDPVDETTTQATEDVTNDVAVNGEEETTAEEATEEVTEVVTNEEGEEVTDKNGEAVTEVVTEKEEATKKEDDKKPTAKPTSPSKKPVSQWSKQEILDYYNKAVKAADAAPEAQKLHGQSKMMLKPGTSITADGGLGSVLKVVSPIVESALSRNSSSTSNVPGYGEIKLDDLKSIKATEKNGVITVELVAKEQTDGPAADGSAGPVGRVIGTLGNIQGALNELGAEFIRGRDTVTLTYTDVTVKATINEATGKITGGKFHYVVNILVKDAQIQISIIKPNVKNLKAYVDYTVTF